MSQKITCRMNLHPFEHQLCSNKKIQIDLGLWHQLLVGECTSQLGAFYAT